MHPIFAERMLTPVYDLTSDSSHERLTYIQGYSGGQLAVLSIVDAAWNFASAEISALVV
jgi:hypothetical protein